MNDANALWEGLEPCQLNITLNSNQELGLFR